MFEKYNNAYDKISALFNKYVSELEKIRNSEFDRNNEIQRRINSNFNSGVNGRMIYDDLKKK